MARLTSTGILFNIADTANSINTFYWIYPAGTVKLFYQATAPTGWTKLATQDNKSLRVVSGTGGGSGGITNFSAVLSSSANNLTVNVNNTFPVQVVSGTGQNVGNTTLALSQLPNHTHTGLIGGTGGSGATPFSFGGSFLVSGSQETGGMVENTGGGSHNHPFSGSATINESRTSSVDLSVQYVDIIICSLN
jgi:hypothetical protein